MIPFSHRLSAKEVSPVRLEGKDLDAASRLATGSDGGATGGERVGSAFEGPNVATHGRRKHKMLSVEYLECLFLTRPGTGTGHS